MLIYVIRRIGLAIWIVLLAVTLLYGMIHLVPGDPVSVILGPRATPELRQALIERMYLDRPFVIQLSTFLWNVARGDLGRDVFSNRPVTTIVMAELPHTLALTLAAIGWALALGIPLGCFSALHPNTILDRLSAVFAVSCIAIPSFVVAICCQLTLAAGLHWFPAFGAGEPGNPASFISHLILPAFAVGLGWVGYLARLVRSSLLEVLSENHIRTARAFGISEWRILTRYALPIAILPTLTLLGVGIGVLLSGALFAEILFARPGIGKLLFDSVTTRNYPVVMGTVLVTTVLFVLSTTISDLITAGLDPRVRSSMEK